MLGTRTFSGTACAADRGGGRGFATPEATHLVPQCENQQRAESQIDEQSLIAHASHAPGSNVLRQSESHDSP
jgi:hypothetical protein